MVARAVWGNRLCLGVLLKAPWGGDGGWGLFVQEFSRWESMQKGRGETAGLGIGTGWGVYVVTWTLQGFDKLRLQVLRTVDDK